MTAPYRDGARAYRGTGLGQAIPVNPRTSAQPEAGLIGAAAPASGDTPRRQEKAWRAELGSWNLGLHLAEGVVSHDVDDADALRAELASRGLPPLPPAPYSTARGADSPRRQLLYRLPGDASWSTRGTIPGSPSPGEIIDSVHRFVRAWPSRHASGRRYHWYAPGKTAFGKGKRLESPPHADRLPILAPEHVAWLTEVRATPARKTATTQGVQEWIDERPDGIPGDELLRLVEAVPVSGMGNNDLMHAFGPLVRAAERAPGGRMALEQAVERYSEGYGPKYRRAALHVIGSAVSDLHAERDARVTFEMPAARPLAPAKTKSEPPLTPKKKAGKKKRPAPLEHDEYIPAGSISICPPPHEPLEVAHAIQGARVLPPMIYRLDTWHLYRDGHWSVVKPAVCENLIYAALRDASWLKAGKDRDVEVSWSPTSSKVREVLRAIQSLVTVDAEPPSWLDGSPGQLVPVIDGLLDPRTGDLQPRSWRYFSPAGHVAARAGGKVEKPRRWLTFLDEIFASDQGSIDLLQEWMGYLVAQDTRRHKGMMIIGRRRSGKGTILHVCEMLAGGESGAFAASLASLSGEFGLQSAVGKSLLTVGDLRGSGREAASAAQKLLEIVGGDRIYINRKGQDPISARLQARVMIASNSMPTLFDDAGVIESRFLLLRTVTSFADREELDLLDQLQGELGGIFAWALAGYRRLEEVGRFTVPHTDMEDRAELRTNSAPISEFLHDACITEGVEVGVQRTDAWQAYVTWCAETGAAEMDRGLFSRALAGAGHPAYRPRVDRGERGSWRYRGLELARPLTAAERATQRWGDFKLS